MPDIKTGVNREYRDRLFKFIFGNPRNKEWTLSLYNAVNGSSYTDAGEIRLTTIENAIYMGMKNDVSFLVTDTMNLYEQQSTYNPNMPMRYLIYGGKLYAKFIEGNKDYHLLSSKLQKAPAPRCICFYNGTAERPDRELLKLSDSFGCEADIEVRVTMININYGHNKELLDACRPLNEYSLFVDNVRTGQKETGSLAEAVDTALEKLPDDSLIKPFLLENKAEVKDMCITEYDEERAFAQQKEEGRAEGVLEGTLKTLLSLVKDNMLTLAEAAKRANMTEAEFEAKAGLVAL